MPVIIHDVFSRFNPINAHRADRRAGAHQYHVQVHRVRVETFFIYEFNGCF